MFHPSSSGDLIGERWPSLEQEQEQAAQASVNIVHSKQGSGDPLLAPTVEESQSNHRPAQTSQGMEGLYRSFSGWMQDSLAESKESLEREEDVATSKIIRSRMENTDGSQASDRTPAEKYPRRM